MRVVVTGGAGFIGGNLMRRLASDPDVTAVTALDDLSTGSRANLAGVDGAELVVG
jgi:UDP-glucose 4-epimerase